jgi:hypothetical protein
MLDLVLLVGQQTINRNNMTIFKRIISVLLGTMIALGVVLTILNIPVYTSNWTLTASQTTGMEPQIFKGSLVVSHPIQVTDLKEGDLTVFGVKTGAPRIGKTIDFEERNGLYLVRAYGSDNEADVITYNTKNTINEVLFSVPLLGYIVTPLISPIGAAVFAGFAVLIGGLYLTLFFKRNPKPEPELEEPEENQFKLLQEIFDEAPARKLNRKERKETIKEMKRKELTNV